MIDQMTAPASEKRQTKVSAVINAPRDAVYRACLDPDALSMWRVPDAMKGHMHSFDGREGGTYQMSLVYQDEAHPLPGKTSPSTDTFRGRFVELVPNRRIVEVVTFETQDQRFTGEMTVTTTLEEAAEATNITMLFENIPRGVRLEDNEAGTKQSLRKLAALLGEHRPGRC